MKIVAQTFGLIQLQNCINKSDISITFQGEKWYISFINEITAAKFWMCTII